MSSFFSFLCVCFVVVWIWWLALAVWPTSLNRGPTTPPLCYRRLNCCMVRHMLSLSLSLSLSHQLSSPTANLPAHFATSQISSVRKQLKVGKQFTHTCISGSITVSIVYILLSLLSLSLPFPDPSSESVKAALVLWVHWTNLVLLHHSVYIL